MSGQCMAEPGLCHFCTWNSGNVVGQAICQTWHYSPEQAHHDHWVMAMGNGLSCIVKNSKRVFRYSSVGCSVWKYEANVFNDFHSQLTIKCNLRAQEASRIFHRCETTRITSHESRQHPCPYRRSSLHTPWLRKKQLWCPVSCVHDVGASFLNHMTRPYDVFHVVILNDSWMLIAAMILWTSEQKLWNAVDGNCVGIAQELDTADNVHAVGLMACWLGWHYWMNWWGGWVWQCHNSCCWRKGMFPADLSN